MKKIVFVPQNETHAENFKLLASRLIAEGYHVLIISLDGIMHQKTEIFFTDLKNRLELCGPKSEVPFYRLASYRQLAIVKYIRRNLPSSLADCDLLVVGNDGAIQRIFAREVARQGGKIAMILDGNLTPITGSLNKFRFHLRSAVSRIAEKVGLEEFVPGCIGHGRLNKTYVMSEYVQKILVSEGVSPATVEVATLPRHEKYREIGRSKPSITHCRPARRVLYVTTAFKWHALHVFAGFQSKELLEISEIASGNANVQFKIRIHPRESISDYKHDFPSNVQITAASNPLENDLKWCDVVWTSRSSVVFEAELASIPCFISNRFFPLPDENDYLSNATNVFFVSNFSKGLHVPVLNGLSANRAVTLPEDLTKLIEGRRE